MIEFPDGEVVRENPVQNLPYRPIDLNGCGSSVRPKNKSGKLASGENSFGWRLFLKEINHAMVEAQCHGFT